MQGGKRVLDWYARATITDLWCKGVKGSDMAGKREMKRHLWALNPPDLKNISHLCLKTTVFCINGFSSIHQVVSEGYTKMCHFCQGVSWEFGCALVWVEGWELSPKFCLILTALAGVVLPPAWQPCAQSEDFPLNNNPGGTPEFAMHLGWAARHSSHLTDSEAYAPMISAGKVL